MIALLESFGLSQSQMQTIVLVGAFAIGIGVILVLYWKFILAGSLAIFCLMLFAHPSDKSVERTPSTIHNELKNESAEDEKMFMEDCRSVTNYSIEECRKLWTNRVEEERQILKEST